MGTWCPLRTHTRSLPLGRWRAKSEAHVTTQAAAPWQHVALLQIVAVLIFQCWPGLWDSEKCVSQVNLLAKLWGRCIIPERLEWICYISAAKIVLFISCSNFLTPSSNNSNCVLQPELYLQRKLLSVIFKIISGNWWWYGYIYLFPCLRIHCQASYSHVMAQTGLFSLAFHQSCLDFSMPVREEGDSWQCVEKCTYRDVLDY